MDAWDISNLPDYSASMDKVKAAPANFVRNSSTPELVADVIYQAATDPSDTLSHADRGWSCRNNGTQGR
jgi:hypothetical protein